MPKSDKLVLVAVAVGSLNEGRVIEAPEDLDWFFEALPRIPTVLFFEVPRRALPAGN